MLKSALLFAAGVARRFYWYLFAFLFRPFSVYERLVQQLLPQKYQFAWPDLSRYFPWVLVGGLFVAAVLTYHDLRLRLTAADARLSAFTPLTIYLVDASVRFLDREKKRAYAFLVSIGNQSDTDNSVVSLDLRLRFTSPSGRSSHLLVRASKERDLASLLEEVEALSGPIRVDGHQSVAGTAYFLVDYELLKGVSVDDYLIEATDSLGRVSSWQAVIVREVVEDVQKAPGDNRLT